MANQIGIVEKDGFTGNVYENPEKSTKFVAWKLASFSADRGRTVPVTGVTGEKGSPRAAAYNLDHTENNSYMRNILGARVQFNAGANRSVDISVPGAQVHVSGYDEPLGLTLSANVGSGSRANVALALGIMADAVVRAVTRGVYAQTEPPEEDEAEAKSEEGVEEIAF